MVVLKVRSVAQSEPEYSESLDIAEAFTPTVRTKETSFVDLFSACFILYQGCATPE